MNAAPTAPGERGGLLRGSVVVLAVLALALLAKYQLVEPMPVASRCQAGGDYPWWCVVRDGIVLLFVKNIAGMASVLLGAWATIQRSPKLAFAAISWGVIGMTLYRFDSAVVGVLLGALVIARVAAGPVRQAQSAERGEGAENPG